MYRNKLKGKGFGKFAQILGVAAIVFGLVTTSAHALSLAPGGANWTTNDNNNCNAACVEGITGIGGLTLLYKADVGSVVSETGSLAGSYTTTFSNVPLDPSDFRIDYNGGEFALCPACILVVKDGKQTPAQYFFNLASWNGQESIIGTGFWPEKGAISHVAIFGNGSATSVPEPNTLLLLGSGLAGLGLVRKTWFKKN